MRTKGNQASSGTKRFAQVSTKMLKRKDKQPLCTYNTISIRIPGHVGKMMGSIRDNWIKPPRKSATKERYADNDMFDPRWDWIMSVGVHERQHPPLARRTCKVACKKYIP
jgi:hypothetical protein